MFAESIGVAARYTLPVVISRLLRNGQCFSGCAAFVLLNEDGWVATAYHVVEEFQRLLKQAQTTQERTKEATLIRSEHSGDKRARQKALRALGEESDTDVVQASMWWGQDMARHTAVHAIPAIDLALCKLDGFALSESAIFPKIADFRRNEVPLGMSVCRLGFPFYNIDTKWEEPEGRFVFPPGAIPAPFFANEGIVSRVSVFLEPGARPADVDALTHPLKCIETSTPGLRGQSGGPYVDASGRLVAIQSKTIHHNLGFDISRPGGGLDTQYLNTGLGIHTNAIIQLAEEHGISIEIV